MIELGTVTDITLPMIVVRVGEHALEHGAVAVFVDDKRAVRVLAHHAADFHGIVKRRAVDLIGVYVARQDYAQGKRQGWSIADDIRTRIAELAGAMAVAA